MKRLRIIYSTTITLFSNVIFKGVGRHPKTGKKKEGIKVHSVIHANEGVHFDVKFTSSATNDSFMLAHRHFCHEEIVALDRAYINYEKFEELTKREVVYVTKMKKGLKYDVLVDCMDQNPDRLMEYREQVVVFRKGDVNHIARISHTWMSGGERRRNWCHCLPTTLKCLWRPLWPYTTGGGRWSGTSSR